MAIATEMRKDIGGYWKIAADFAPGKSERDGFLAIKVGDIVSLDGISYRVSEMHSSEYTVILDEI